MKTNQKLFNARAVKIDINDGNDFKVLLNAEQAWNSGITTLDKIKLIHKWNEIFVDVDLTDDLVDFGRVWITNDTHKQFDINEWDMITIQSVSKTSKSITAIKKKLLWKKLRKDEVFELIKDMSDWKLSDTLLAYYAACSFCYPSDEEEMYYTAKYSADLWDKLTFENNTSVKYSVWWLPGNETTMIIVPILASLWLYSPKTFSKSITTPAATWECVETLMNINLTVDQMKDIVKEIHWCLAWWKVLKFAPANDKIIKVSYPLSMEAYSKMVVSIIAKIYAWWTKNCLIEIPVWPNAKVTTKKVANRIKSHFQYIAKRLWLKFNAVITDGRSPVGRWIWAVLQTREVLRILQSKKHNSKDLEEKAISLSAKLIELNWLAKWEAAKKMAYKQLKNWEARNKMKEIIAIQNKITNQSPNLKDAKHLWPIDSEDLPLAKYSQDIKAQDSWIIEKIDILSLKYYARELGCPVDRKAGFYFHKTVWDKFKKWDIIYTIYSSDQAKIELVKQHLIQKGIINN